MAFDDEQRKKLEKVFNKQQLEEYINLVKLLNKEIDEVTFNKTTESVKNATKALEDLKIEQKQFTSDISYAAKGFKEIVNQISKTRSNLKDATSQFSELQKISQKLLYNQQDISSLSEKDIAKLKEQAAQVKSRMDITRSLLEDEFSILSKKKDKTDAELAQLAKTKAAKEEIQSILEGENSLYGGLLLTLNDVGKQLENQKKLMGGIGALASTLKGVLSGLGAGELANFLGIDDALSKIQLKAKEAIKAEERIKEIANERNILEKSHIASQELNIKALEEQQIALSKIAEEKQRIQAEYATTPGPQELAQLAKELEVAEQQQELTENKIKKLNEEISKSETLYKEALKILEIEKKQSEALKNSVTKAGLLLDFYKEMGKNLLEKVKDPLFGVAAAFKLLKDSFLALNKAQTEFSRETGHTVKHFDTITDSITTSVDYIKQASALTKQMGMDATAIFSKDTLTEAAELVELMGLSAEESGKLAQISKLNGKEFRTQNTAIFNQLANFNKLNKTVITGKALMQDISKLSNTVLVNFKGNERSMVEATAAAKKFGLELAQIDKIADSLLDFESSISTELEAELLTGKEFNMERARFLSLNNDIEGLTKEIVNNEQVRAAFASGNRVQQEAVAKMYGMQKDDIAKMIIMDAQRQGLSDSAIARAAGMTEEDYKRLSIQESINKSMEKLGEAMAGPLQVLAELVSKGDTLKGIFKALLVILGAIAVIKFGSMINQLVQMAVTATTAAASAAAWASGITLGLGAIAIGASIAYIISEMNAASDAAEANVRSAGDMFSAKGVTTVSTSEGGLFKTSPNDEMIVAPGISRMLGTNTSSQNNSALIAEIKALRTEMSQKKQNIVVNVENKPVVGTTQIVAGLREQYKIE